VAFCRDVNEGLKKIHDIEKKLLDLMPETSYSVRDIKVRVDPSKRCFLRRPESEFSIHTVVVGEEHLNSGKPPIVLVHGFMLGAAGFWKWLPLLAQHRTVYAIDVIGMGGSGRPPFEAGSLTAEAAESLLVDPFQQWVEAMELNEFDLLGHSFGGFVCSAWASRYPEKIRSLGLLSPLLGFSDARIDKFRGAGQELSWQAKAMRSALETAWSRHLTPQTIVRWVPGAKGWMERASTRRFQSMASGVTQEEGRLLSEYVVATMDMPSSTESSATVCFEPFLRPTEVSGGTIKQRLSTLRTPLYAIYGDRDWMDRATIDEVPNCSILELPKSGHHLYLDNPEVLTSLVVSELAKANYRRPPNSS